MIRSLRDERSLSSLPRVSNRFAEWLPLCVRHAQDGLDGLFSLCNLLVNLKLGPGLDGQMARNASIEQRGELSSAGRGYTVRKPGGW